MNLVTRNKRLVFWVFMCLKFQAGTAQVQESHVQVLKIAQYEKVLLVQGKYQVQLDSGVGALFIRVNEKEELPASFYLDQKQINVKTQPHSPIGYTDSELYFTHRKTTKIEVYARQPVELHLLKFPKLKSKPIAKRLNKNDGCAKPDMVLGSTWRQGLNPPVVGRTATEVKHIVVHHSAGSNSLNDWQEAVRAIYIYHTESNGWDDIGYNFLIDPNGVVYEGRESQGVADIDNIKGAHFCGKNSGTMGVCLIGNYMNIQISDTMRSSLIALCSWKCFKEGLYPSGSSIHPIGSSTFLGHIVGHRDGCSTNCPGDRFYPTLSAVVDSVRVQYENCGGFVGTNSFLSNSIFVSPNPAGTHFFISNMPTAATVELLNTSGHRVLISKDGNRIDISTLPPGMYTLLLTTPSRNTRFIKLLKTP
jgi:hypothetical protein